MSNPEYSQHWTASRRKEASLFGLCQYLCGNPVTAGVASHGRSKGQPYTSCESCRERNKHAKTRSYYSRRAHDSQSVEIREKAIARLESLESS